MARIEISSVSNPYGTGELQLQGKVAMSGTLTAVTDNLNNASPLKLSTGGVQVASTLQITTNSNPYIDAEDGAGNNRFTVGRDPSSQVVNVDFASNPTGGTNMVGGIRTYTDGVNLSQVMSFRKDGNIGIGTSSPASILQVIGTTNIARFGTSTNYWKFNTNYSSDQSLEMVNQGGAGTNTYYNTKLLNETYQTKLLIGEYQNYLSFGKYDNHQMASLFNNGNFVVGSSSDLSARIGIKGSGSTSATTSLLVQNSGGSESLRITDDRVVKITSSSSSTALNVEFGNINSNVKILSHGSSDFSQIQIGTNFSLERNGGGDPSITTTFGLGVICSSLSLQTSTNSPSKLWIRGNYGLGSAYFGANNSNGVSPSTLYFQNSETPTAEQNVIATFNLWGISDNATAPSLPSSSMFSLQSTTRGFLPPRMTTIQKNAIVSPAIGLMVFDTTLNRPCFYNGIWVTL